MRFNAIGLLLILLIINCFGCRNGESPATETAGEAGPQPTPVASPVVGVDFATVTPPGQAGAPVDVQTPAASAPPTETATATPEVYVVQSGDTLVGIAAARGVSLEEILALNPDVQPELLLVGQEIVVPPRPSIQPTAAPAAAGPISVEIAGLSTYASATGGTWVLGEVVNGGSQAAELVQVRVALASADDLGLASETLWITPVTIPPSGRAPFGALFSDVGSLGVTAEAEVVGGRQVHDLGSRYLDLAVSDAEVTIGPNPIRVSGSVENQGEFSAGQISLVTTFYDEQGLVTGYHELLLDEVLGPGESRPFTLVSLPPGGRADGWKFAFQATVAP